MIHFSSLPPKHSPEWREVFPEVVRTIRALCDVGGGTLAVAEEIGVLPEVLMEWKHGNCFSSKVFDDVKKGRLDALALRIRQGKPAPQT